MMQISTAKYTITINKFIDIMYVDIQLTNPLALNILDNIMLYGKE